MSEESNVLTFSELRKTQKEEDREEELTELDDKFVLRASNYFDKKKENEGKSREYKNAKRVFDKIISLREEKIVKEARLSVKTDSQASKLNLLPEEQELFRNLRNEFKRHRSHLDDSIESNTATIGNTKKDEKKVSEAKKEEENEEPEEKEQETEGPSEQEDQSNEEEVEDGYKLVEVTSDVPEFMGTDLEAYGPFEPGEKVEIPEDNAEILVNRGNAELIQTS